MNVRLHGNTIVLRDWKLADFDLYRMWFQPGHKWKELDAPYYPLPPTEHIEAFLQHKREEIEQDSRPAVRTKLVIADKATDTLLGAVTWNWESWETCWPLVGLVLFDPASWGQGRGFESLGLWSDYLFTNLPEIIRLDLRTWSGNHGMMRLAEKLGYQQEACFRQARIVNGQYYDALAYGILHPEWKTRYPNGFAHHLYNT